MAEVCDDLGIPAGRGRQKALGAMFGVTPKAARKWLVGDGYPELEMAVRISERAGVNLNWLLQGAGPKRGDKVETKALVLGETVQALGAAQGAEVLDFIRFKLSGAHAARLLASERVTRYMKMLDAFKADIQRRRNGSDDPQEPR